MSHIAAAYMFLLIPCILVSAFFSGSEAAFLSLRKVRIRSMAENEVKGAKRIANMVDQPEKVLPTILLCNNLANTAFAAICTVIMVALIGEGQGVIVATITSTLVLLVLGETVPKTVGIRYPETLFFFSANILIWTERLLLPIVIVLQSINKLLARKLKTDPGALFTEEEIKTAISIGLESGSVEEREAQMLENVFRFGDRQLREVMTPRTELILVESGTTLQEFLAIYSDHTHTRFPVYNENVDNILGTLLIKDVLEAMANSTISHPQPVTGLLRPVSFVPDTKPAGILLRDMQNRGIQMAMAVDEFGGIAGLVTLKQLTEEIVGPVGEDGIYTEIDYETIAENTYSVDAGMQIEEVNDELGINLPRGNYGTVAGFLLEQLGHIPTEGETLRYDNIHLTISDVVGMRIEKIVLRMEYPKKEV